MAGMTFDSSLVDIIEKADDYQEVEARLADRLHDLGYVKDSYAAALAKREEDFPTGLHLGRFNAAMPHCDPEHVSEGAICLGVLKQPVPWRLMDDKAQTCDVSIVIMLAITDPKEHIAMLRKVIGLIQDQALVERVISCDDTDEVFRLTAKRLI